LNRPTFRHRKDGDDDDPVRYGERFGARRPLATARACLDCHCRHLARYQLDRRRGAGPPAARALFPAASLVAAVTRQIIALFRALRIEDDEVGEYRKTVRWLIASAIALLVGLSAAMLDATLSS